jgi:hypothetical protein
MTNLLGSILTNYPKASNYVVRLESVLDQDELQAPILYSAIPSSKVAVCVCVCESTWRSANKQRRWLIKFPSMVRAEPRYAYVDPWFFPSSRADRTLKFLNPRSRRRRISSSSVLENGVTEMAAKDDEIAVVSVGRTT